MNSARRLDLRNGSASDRPLPQVLEAQQHGQHPFELAVEMDLVAAESFQLVGVKRLTERLLADRRAAAMRGGDGGARLGASLGAGADGTRA